MKSRWAIVVGLALVLGVVLVRDDVPQVGLVEVAPLPTGAADSAEQAVPVTAPAPRETPASSAAAPVDEQIPDACKATVTEALAFAETEANAADPLSAGADVTEFDNSPLRLLELSRDRVELGDLPGRLRGAADPDAFLTAFALDRPETQVRTDPSAQATLLELGLRAADSDSALLKWHALRVCAAAEAYCPFAHLEQVLLEGLTENSEAWALAATLRYRRGDVAGALAAMQSAARAATSSWYWTETIAAIASVLAEHTSMPHGERASAATGYAAAALPSIQRVSQMCRAGAETSRAWADACLEYGRLQAEHNETMMARGVAYSFQRQALAAIGDSQGVQEVAEAYALLSAEMNAAGASSAWLNVLLGSSPERFDAHLSAVREHGELEGGRVFLRRELPPLLERAGLLDRDGARECIAKFFEAPAPAEATFRDYPIEDYPLQVGDELLISVTGRSQYSSLRVGPDGAIRLPRLLAISAVGKTTGQIRTEIAALAADTSNPAPQVVVILMAPRSPEQRRAEFDEALREAKETELR